MMITLLELAARTGLPITTLRKRADMQLLPYTLEGGLRMVAEDQQVAQLALSEASSARHVSSGFYARVAALECDRRDVRAYLAGLRAILAEPIPAAGDGFPIGLGLSRADYQTFSLALDWTSRETGVEELLLVMRPRRADLVEARFLLCGLLAACGLRPMVIARLLHRHHSTIVHALRRAAEIAGADVLLVEGAAHVREALLVQGFSVAADTTPADVSLQYHLDAHLYLPDVNAVLHYVRYGLLGTERCCKAALYVRGLALLAARPDLCRIVRGILAGAGHDGHCALLDRQVGEWRGTRAVAIGGVA